MKMILPFVFSPSVHTYERDLALNMSRVAQSQKRNLNMSASRPDAADWAPLNTIKNHILVCVKGQRA